MRLIIVCCVSGLGLLGQDRVPAFRAQTIERDVGVGYGIAIGDVDGDEKPDVLMADRRAFVWYRNGSWKRRVLAANVTRRDNVCLAARDLDGDGRVELAVGGRWNPGETVDLAKSGSVHWLARPESVESPWLPRALVHEPTVHRMRWVRDGKGRHELVVLPLHGRGNRRGRGAGVRVLAYRPPPEPSGAWTTSLVDDTLHVTHNLDVVAWDDDPEEEVLVAAREGVFLLDRSPENTWRRREVIDGTHGGAGEVRLGRIGQRRMVATIEPFHGPRVAVSVEEDTGWRRVVLDEGLRQGHALACADLLGLGRDQIIAGWRQPNADGKVGIRLYVPDPEARVWTRHTLDDGKMACEDLRIADLDGDGDLDVVASGRATHNLVIYWNERK